jgi:hypothetical protein
MPVGSTDAKLLYFLNIGLTDIDIAFGAGIFVNIDKAHGMRVVEDPNSAKLGRLTLNDIINKVPVKKDLFVVCAAGKLGVIGNMIILRVDLTTFCFQLLQSLPWMTALLS